MAAVDIPFQPDHAGKGGDDPQKGEVTMKRSIQAQPEEVTEAVTGTWYVTPKIIRLGEESFRLNYDAIGVTLSDTGSGLFHMEPDKPIRKKLSTTRCLRTNAVS